MRILITGARAPAALDLARRFHSAGHQVFVADSLRLAMTMFSRVAQQRFHLPAPRYAPEQFISTLSRLIETHRIELVVPTCEEVFVLSRFADQLPCRVLVDEFPKLAAIHNKFTFAGMAENSFAAPPETHLLVRVEQLPGFLADSNEWVFKPVYSRFASKTLVGPSPEELSRLSPSPSVPWVAQRRIRGQEFSTYSVASQGKLQAHVCYKSVYRAGKGAGICFSAVTHPEIEGFVRQFVEHQNFNGQIGFDLIETNEGRVYVLEGNPRTTSGVHLFDGSKQFPEAMIGESECVVVSGNNELRMVEFAMPLWGLLDSIQRGVTGQFIQDFRRAKGLSFAWRDPLPVLALPFSLAELLCVAIRRRCGLLEASTADIEWNGEPL